MPVRGFLIVAKNIVNTCVHIGSVIYIFVSLPPPPKKKINKQKQKPCRNIVHWKIL